MYHTFHDMFKFFFLNQNNEIGQKNINHLKNNNFPLNNKHRVLLVFSLMWNTSVNISKNVLCPQFLKRWSQIHKVFSVFWGPFKSKIKYRMNEYFDMFGTCGIEGHFSNFCTLLSPKMRLNALPPFLFLKRNPFWKKWVLAT